MKRNEETLKRLPTIMQAWKEYTTNFLYVWSQFTTNLQNSFITVFYPMLPQLSSLFLDLANRLSAFTDFIEAHPNFGSKLSGGLLDITLMLGLRGGVGALILGIRALGAAAAATALTTTGAAIATTRFGAAAGFLDKVMFAGLFGWLAKLGPVNIAMKALSVALGAAGLTAGSAAIIAVATAIAGVAAWNLGKALGRGDDKAQTVENLRRWMDYAHRPGGGWGDLPLPVRHQLITGGWLDPVQEKKVRALDKADASLSSGETHIHIDHLVLPGVKNAKDLHPALNPWIQKSLPAHQTSPNQPFVFSF